MTSRKIISVDSLTKVYDVNKGLFKKKKIKSVRALDKVTFDVLDEELVCLLGPNGAGKTTLIKLLTLLLLPTSGSFTLNGFEGNLKYEHQIKSSIGAMLMGERGLYWKLTGLENLQYFYALYHQPKNEMKDYIDYLLNLMNLDSISDRPVESYSSGQKMKFAFLRSLISDPPILILDEPTIAMDVQGARELRKIIKELQIDKKKTVLYSTHIMSEVEELAERVLIVDKGKVIDYDTVENLTSGLDQDESITVEGKFPEISEIKITLEALSGVKNVAYKQSQEIGKADSLIIQVGDSKRDMPDIISNLISNNAKIDYLYPKKLTIEDVFIRRTGHTLSADTSI